MKAPKDINILIACEESQAICKEFRKLGYNAFSCDLKPCSGGYPKWHIMSDCFERNLITNPPTFFTDSLTLDKIMDESEDKVNDFYTSKRGRNAIQNYIPCRIVKTS